MKITIEIDTAPRGGNYLTEDDIEWMKIRERARERQRKIEYPDAPPTDWLDALRRFYIPPQAE